MAKKDEENSLDEGNPAYVGVSPEYQNSAYDINKAMVSEDEDQAAQEQAARKRQEEAEAAAAKVSNHTGFTVDDTHPSERKQPTTDIIEGNEAIRQAQVAEAKARLADEGGGSDDEGATPFDK